MPSAGASLFWISLIAVLAPLVAGFVPRRLLPEVVLLLVFGMLVGPNVLGLAVDGAEVDLLRELGLGMLFLLAGFEIDVSEITGRGAVERWSPGWSVSPQRSGRYFCSGNRVWPPRRSRWPSH